MASQPHSEQAVADEISGTLKDSLIEELLHYNKKYVAEGRHHAYGLGVKRRLVVLTCMDSR